MTHYVDTHEFLKLAQESIIIDVRTPAEFEKGHIPGAVNIPLFSNEERAEVGTLYKSEGRDQAVLRGLEFVGPKLADFIRQTKEVSTTGEVLVHCWRGGMRSSSFAWLLETAGLKARVLTGGYKDYRRYVRDSFARPTKIIIIGGMTGSGKTELLHHLESMGEQILDLEGVAHHKGSGFGFINQGEQPSNEQFENDSYNIWKNFSTDHPVWIEDESLKIGRVVINEPLYKQMREAPVIKVELPKKVRIERLYNEYCVVPPEVLSGVIQKISKRLGSERTIAALDYISNNKYREAIDVVLDYYDRGYTHGMKRRVEPRIFELAFEGDDMEELARKVLDFYNSQNLHG